MSRLFESLPTYFPFFHLGHVELDETGEESLPDQTAVAFTLQGEARGVLALLFEEGLDISTYSELGNIIASQLATDLSRRHGLDVTISPPRVLTAPQLEDLLTDGRGQLRAYLHHHNGLSTRLQALIISTENMGNA